MPSHHGTQLCPATNWSGMCRSWERPCRATKKVWGLKYKRLVQHREAEGAELLQSGKRVIYQLTSSLQQVKQPTATWRETVRLKKPYSSWQCQMIQKGEMTRNCQLGGSGWLFPHPKLSIFNSGVVQAYNRVPSEADQTKTWPDKAQLIWMGRVCPTHRVTDWFKCNKLLQIYTELHLSIHHHSLSLSERKCLLNFRWQLNSFTFLPFQYLIRLALPHHLCCQPFYHLLFVIHIIPLFVFLN